MENEKTVEKDFHALYFTRQQMKGTIFDIQRFALHDGPGIRSVAFLKGCPLRCKWCCNPESQRLERELAFSQEKCNASFQCVSVCEEGVHQKERGIHTLDLSRCNYCNACVDACSSRALKIYGYEMDSAEVVNRFLQDVDYYKNSNGGITLSGGEPLFQFEFALDILQKSKASGLHTAVETTGYVSVGRMKKILPFVDLFLYDYKITDNELHQEYTGVSNRQIIENLKNILNEGAKVHLRCIVIPGINDDDLHFRAIAGLAAKYPTIEKVELMPYHEYGKHKYAGLNREYFDFGVKTINADASKYWLSKLKALGCEKATIG